MTQNKLFSFCLFGFVWHNCKGVTILHLLSLRDYMQASHVRLHDELRNEILQQLLTESEQNHGSDRRGVHAIAAHSSDVTWVDAIRSFGTPGLMPNRQWEKGTKRR